MAEKKDRIINYFDIAPKYLASSTETIIDLFTKINQLKIDKDPARFEQYGDKYIYITDIVINKTTKQIDGKVLHIRKDAFPELMDISDDKIRDVEATKNEGIVEKTHFILSYKKKEMTLSFEHNQYGARISDFTFYLEQKGLKNGILDKILYNPISRDNLTSVRKRIKNISYIVAKVHKDNIKRIKEYDEDLFSALKTVEEATYAEYVTLELKYDYVKGVQGTAIRSKLDKIIDKLIKSTSIPFNKLQVKAEDSESNNLLKDFDLLNLWYRSNLKVELKDKSKTIVSVDILEKMRSELNKEFGL
ncbi:hypothetical protein [Flavobacterium sp.]|jgi:hypothetical protein|uniref:hypothetical protein n=1 Tax=Flavobacterium sp. TaxID=239 RepID=UPI0037C120C1